MIAFYNLLNMTINNDIISLNIQKQAVSFKCLTIYQLGQRLQQVITIWRNLSIKNKILAVSKNSFKLAVR